MSNNPIETYVNNLVPGKTIDQIFAELTEAPDEVINILVHHLYFGGDNKFGKIEFDDNQNAYIKLPIPRYSSNPKEHPRTPFEALCVQQLPKKLTDNAFQHRLQEVAAKLLKPPITDSEVAKLYAAIFIDFLTNPFPRNFEESVSEIMPMDGLLAQ